MKHRESRGYEKAKLVNGHPKLSTLQPTYSVHSQDVYVSLSTSAFKTPRGGLMKSPTEYTKFLVLGRAITITSDLIVLTQNRAAPSGCGKNRSQGSLPHPPCTR